MSKKTFTPGTRVQFTDGRKGTVIPSHLIPLDKGLKPLVPGYFGVAVDWARQVAISLDGGGTVVKFKNELKVIG